MTPYYINMLLIFGFAWPLCLRRPCKTKKAAYLAVTFGYMWFLAAFRVDTGFDYESYIDIFARIKAAPGWPAALSLGFEPGFAALTRLMTRLVWSPAAMYAVYSALILLPVALFIYRWSDERDTWLAVWCYVALAYFYSSMNFVRQNLACGILLLGYKFLREKKTAPYIAVALLSACFHITALIMIPLYFLAHIRTGKKMGIIYAAAALFSYACSGIILDFVTRHIFTAYRGSVYINEGFRISFLVMPAAIFGLCLAVRNIWAKRSRDESVLLNMMLFSTVIWLFVTRHFILERFSHYPYQLALLAVPQALSCLRASAQDIALRSELLEKQARREPGRKPKGLSDKEKAVLRDVTQNISDHKKYYWNAVAPFLVISLAYNYFGMHVNNFHNVFPYKSLFDFRLF